MYAPFKQIGTEGCAVGCHERHDATSLQQGSASLSQRPVMSRLGLTCQRNSVLCCHMVLPLLGCTG